MNGAQHHTIFGGNFRFYAICCALCFVCALHFNTVWAYSIKESENESVSDSLLLWRVSTLFNHHESDSCIAICKQWLESPQSIGSTNTKARILTYAGLSHYVKSEYASAEKYFSQALVLNRTLNNRSAIGKLLLNLGQNAYYQGKYHESIGYLYEAMAIYATLKNAEDGKAAVRYEIGRVYFKTNERAKAFRFLNEAAEIYMALGNKKRLANTLNTMGMAYREDGDYPKAIAYQKQSLALKQTLKDTKGMAASYNGLGITCRSQGSLKEALHYYRMALAMQDSVNDKTGKAATLSNIGLLYMAERNYTLAKAYLLAADSLATAIGYIELQTNNTYALGELYEAIGRPGDALKYFKKHMVLQDSLVNTDKQRQIAALQTRFETAEKQLENERLTKENELQQLSLNRHRTIIITLIVAGILVTIIIALFISRMRSNAKIKLILLEQRLLRSQMNPHFIFNALGSIQSFVLTNKPVEAAGYLSRFSRLMRGLLQDTRVEMITISEEMAFLEDYIQLQALRFNHCFTYIIVAEPDIETEHCLIPALITQPFVENAIIHGLKNLPFTGHLEVRFAQFTQWIMITVTDNGTGISSENAEEITPHQPFGTALTAERLKLLYGSDQAMIKTEPLYAEKRAFRGTKITVSLPLKMNE